MCLFINTSNVSLDYVEVIRHTQREGKRADKYAVISLMLLTLIESVCLKHSNLFHLEKRMVQIGS